MLVSYSVALTRSRRHHSLLPGFRVTSLDVARILIEEAAHLDQPIALEMGGADAKGPELRYLLDVAAHSAMPVSIISSVPAQTEAVTAIIASGAQTVLLNLGDISEADAVAHLSWAEDYASDRGVEVAVSLEGYTHSWEALAKQRRGVFSVVAVHTRLTGSTHRISGLHVARLRNAYRCPLVATDTNLSISQCQHLARAGVSGWLMPSVLDEVFSASLRTALRGHEDVHQVRVLRTLRTAISCRLESLSEFL